MKIYVASSWRNQYQQVVVDRLRAENHEVYDFRNPAKGNTGFKWSDLSKEWQTWTTGSFRRALRQPIANKGFRLDFEAMKWADACALILPCGRSAHLEAGWFAGARKPVHVLLAEGEPELMYKMCSSLSSDLQELVENLEQEAHRLLGSSSLA